MPNYLVKATPLLMNPIVILEVRGFGRKEKKKPFGYHVAGRDVLRGHPMFADKCDQARARHP